MNQDDALNQAIAEGEKCVAKIKEKMEECDKAKQHLNNTLQTCEKILDLLRSKRESGVRSGVTGETIDPNTGLAIKNNSIKYH